MCREASDLVAKRRKRVAVGVSPRWDEPKPDSREAATASRSAAAAASRLIDCWRQHRGLTPTATCCCGSAAGRVVRWSRASARSDSFEPRQRQTRSERKSAVSVEAILTCLIAATILIAGSSRLQAGDAIVVDLWPGPAPGETAAPANDTIIPVRPNENPPTTRLTDVTGPQMFVYRPSAEANTGVAILVCPGGGFNHLAWDKEGTEVAEWLSTIGITGVALKYRCPTKQDRATQHLKPLQDAQRAMSLLRSRAEEWNIDPEQIGILGFSAGGHLAARLALHPGEREDDADDAEEEYDGTPAFAVLLYPAYLLNEQQDGLDAQAFHVKRSSPPMFIAYAQDDKIPSPGALYLAIALKQAGVSCELHQYAAGGHGYGMRPADLPAVTWPARLEEWLRQQGRVP